MKTPKTDRNEPSLKRQDLYRAVAFICILAMLINPLAGVSYADIVSEESPSPDTTLTSIHEEEPETSIEADIEEEPEAPADTDPEEEAGTPVDEGTDSEEEAGAPVDEGAGVEEEPEAPAAESGEEQEASAGDSTGEKSPELDATPPLSILPQSMEMLSFGEMSLLSAPDMPVIMPSTSEWSDDVIVTITGTLPDLGEIQYKVGSGASWKGYTGPVTMTEEGEHTVYARVVNLELDESGDDYASDIAYATYKLDKTPPEISMSGAVEGDTSIITVTVSDTYSGVAVKKYAEGTRDADYFADGGTELTTTFAGIAGDEYTVFAADNCGNTVVEQFTLKTQPEISCDDDKVYGTEDTELFFSFTVSDDSTSPEALSVTVTADDTALFPGPFTVENTDGTCVARTMPGADQNGSTILTIKVSNGFFETTKTITAEVAAVNDVPVAVDDDYAETDKNKPVTIDVLANDSDPDTADATPDAIFIQSVSNGSYGMTEIIGGGTLLIYTPENNWHGTDTFSYEIADSVGATASAMVTVKISYANYLPVVSGLDAIYNVDEDTTLVVEFLLQDDETPNESITAQVKSSNQSIIKNSNIIVEGLGDADPGIRLKIMPEPNAYGNGVIITIKASDGFNIAEYTFTVNVLPVNDAPVAANDSFSFTEDLPLTFTAAELTANDKDIDGDLLTFGRIGTDVEIEKGTLNYDPGTETFTYTPEPDWEGDVSFTYYVSDGKLESAAPATVTLKCTPVNDAPFISHIEDKITQEDIVLAGIEFQIGDPETAATHLIVAVGSSNQKVVSDNKIVVSGVSGTRYLTITPNANANTDLYGETKISITVSDGEHHVTKSFDLTVEPAQDPPTAVDDIAMVKIKGSVTIPVLINDFDVDKDTITLTAVTSPAIGSTVLNSDGTITFTAHDTYVGMVSFPYAIHDGHGNEATAEVRISCINDVHAPILSRIADQATEEDLPLGSLKFLAIDLVDLSSLKITASSSNVDLITSGGIFIEKITDPNYNYSVSINPVGNKSGTSTITITAVDSQGSSYSISFQVIVYPVNDPPVAQDDKVNTDEDTFVTFNVLSNDSDLESGVSVLSIGSPANGKLEPLGSGTYSYTPNPNWNGTETILYTIMDEDAAQSAATVTIVVAPVNDPPTARNDYQFNIVSFDIPITINVLSNDDDIDLHDSGSTEIILIESCSDPDAIIDNVAGTITFPADSEFAGATKTYTYTIVDSGGLTASATILLTKEAPASGAGFYLYPYSTTIMEDSPEISIDLSSYINKYTDASLTLGLSGEPGKTPTGGAASVDGKVVRYTPGLNENGTDVFYYTVSDGTTTKEQTITIHILPVNDPPVLTTPAGITVEEDAGIPDVTVNMSDVDNKLNDLIFVVGSSNQSALASDEITVIKEEDGQVTLKFAPAPHANGSTVITMKVSDGLGFAEQSFTINITPLNDTPSAIDIYKELDEDTSIYINLLGGSSDPDIGDILSASIVSMPSNGNVTVDDKGLAYYTPALNYNGSDSFQYRVVDEDGADPVCTVHLTIHPVYDPTAILNLTSSAITTKNQPVTVTFDIPNPDDREITVSMESKNRNLVDDLSPGAITITKVGTHYTATVMPEWDETGNALIVVKANDGIQDYIAVFTLYVTTAVGDVTAVDDGYTINEDMPTKFNVIANDTDTEGDTLSVISHTTPSHGAIVNNMDGTLNYKPNLNYNGTDSFQYTVSDPYGNTDWATVYITISAVNDAPAAVDDSRTTEEDEPILIDVLDNDFDVDGDTISLVKLTTLPANGAAEIVFITGGAQGVRYTPKEDYHGSDSFTYTITDGTLESTAMVRLTIAEMDDPPKITEAAIGTPWIWEMEEDRAASFNVTITDAETASNNLLVKITSSNKTLIADSNIRLTRSGENYTIHLTPSPDQVGTLELKIIINDGENEIEQPVTVTINPVNDAPTFTVDTVETVNEDSGNHVAVNWAKSISAGAANESGQVLNFEVTIIETDNASLFSMPPAISSNGALTFRPAPDQFGTATVSAVLKDNGGTSNGGVDTSVPKTFRIVVNPVNDPPSFTHGDNQTVDEDSGPHTVTGWASVTCFGPANESGQGILEYIVSTTNTALFSVQPAVSTAGALTYMPAPDANGTATVTVRLRDNGGTERGGQDKSTEASFTITVNPMDDNPVAADDSGTVNEDSKDNLLDVLANDRDADKDWNGEGLSIESVGTASHGTVSISGSAVVYTPVADYYGPDSFTYVMKDERGTTSSAMVTVTVAAVNDAPLFTHEGDQTVNEDSGPHTVAGWASVTSFGPANESDQTVLKYIVTATSNAALFSVQPAVSAAGALTYTLASDANGTATVTVVLQDNGGTERGGQDKSTESAFTITVNPVNDAPKFTVDAVKTVNEDSGNHVAANWAKSISAGASNESGQALTFEVTIIETDNAYLFSTPPAISSNGTLTFSPAPDQFGTATVSAILRDNGGTSNGGADTSETKIFRIVVLPVNDAPSFTISASSIVVDEDSGISGLHTLADWVTSFDPGKFNESDQTIKEFIVTNDNNGLFAEQPAISAGKTLTFKLAKDANGAATVSAVLVDSGGTDRGGKPASAAVTFTITVNQVADDPKAVDDSYTVNEDSTNNFLNVLSNDRDADKDWNGEGLSIESVGSASNGTAVLSGGAVFYTPNADYYGPDSFTYVMEDERGETDSATVTITVAAVNDQPSFAISAGSIVVNEDSGASGLHTFADWVTSFDPGKPNESDNIEKFIVTNDNNGLFAEQPAISAGKTLTFKLAKDAYGAATVSAVLVDSGGTDRGGNPTSAAVTFTITVNPVNDAPTFTVHDVTVNEDCGEHETTAWASNIKKGPDNESGQTLSFVILTTTNSALFSVQPAISSSGELTFTPADHANGEAEIAVQIQDNGGMSYGGINTSEVKTFKIIVRPVNDQPSVILSGTAIVVDEDSGVYGLHTLADWVTSFDLGADEPDQTIKEYIVTNDNNVLFEEQPAISTGGVLTFKLAKDANGAATVSAILIDDGGTNLGGNPTSAAVTFTITVNPVNDAPVAKDDNVSVDEDSSVLINVLANDTDIDGDSLTILSVGTASHGAVSISGGAVVYTPAADYYGSDSFSYIVKDPSGATSSAIVTVTVNEANDAPVATGAAIATSEDTPTSGAIEAADVEGDTLTYVTKTEPAHGSVVVNADGSYTYTPNKDYNGSDSFEVTVSDGELETTATITVTVTAVNDAPVATGAAIATPEDTPTSGAIESADVEGDTLTYVTKTEPAHGSVVVNADGSYTYTPNKDYNGSD
ncbi:MAG: Ig-like domain-containing protein, partial [Eubacteriales bacterium]|nr:Ig-like domain-containing protein [Eubacteriales bacterium]